MGCSNLLSLLKSWFIFCLFQSSNHSKQDYTTSCLETKQKSRTYFRLFAVFYW
ncbi:hypothetical protein HMPREF0322_04297 [Desulfitobacterium hafniense DP7]|uniref:Uncharacterized protein n=1 Tax=Desulfitobacterium hafniense DP7 TaxID=537010 RepID=G9XTI9_DESHA|nr:hypothetical protein HMPREF0322_04297 [Desulfitobacterium hafniense DP7]